MILVSKKKRAWSWFIFFLVSLNLCLQVTHSKYFLDTMFSLEVGVILLSLLLFMVYKLGR